MLNKTHKQFILWFAVIFLATFTGLYILGLIPSEFADEGQASVLDQVLPTVAVIPENIPVIESKETVQNRPIYHGENPQRIVISKIGVDAHIGNPTKTDAATLDDALTRGAVHYPGSGLLADGNVFLFGHSTNWSVVHNQAYKTFNNLKDLKAGDVIKVYGTSQVFTYSVTSVTLADDSKVWVDLSGNKKMLTLSTCNTFGQKQQRYVVQAEYLTSASL